MGDWREGNWREAYDEARLDRFLDEPEPPDRPTRDEYDDEPRYRPELPREERTPDTPDRG